MPHRDAWAAGSLAVVVPLLAPPATGWHDGAHDLSRTHPWGLTMLGRGSLVVPPQQLRHHPIGEARVRGALAPAGDDYHVWINRPGDYMGRFWTALPGDWELHPGCFVTAVEHVVHREPQEAAYVVLHVQLQGPALLDPVGAAAFFAHPTSADDQADLGWFGAGAGNRERLDHRVLDGLLRELGVLDEGTYQPWERPFVISHLVPRGSGFRDTLPPYDLADHLAVGWLAEHAWAARMAGGTNLDLVREPELEPTPAQDSGFWLGSTWAYPRQHGLSFVAARGVAARPTGTDEGTLGWTNADGDRPYAEHAATAALAHRHAVDLVLLSMRQARFLRDLADRLPRTLNPADQRHRLRLAQQRQEELMAFRSRFWVTHVPSHPEASQVLAGVQAAMGLPALYAEVDRQQDDVARALSIAVGIEREDQRDRDVARTDRLDARITVLGAVLAVSGVVFGMAQLTGEAGWSYAWVVTLAAVLLSPLLLAGVLAARRRPAPGRPAGVEALVAEVPRRAIAGQDLHAFARRVADEVPECADGWTSTTDRHRSVEALADDVRAAVYSTSAAQLRDLHARFSRHPAGSDCRCAGLPIGLAAVAWNRHTPREVVLAVLRQPGLLGDPAADDALTAGTLEAHGAVLDADTTWSLYRDSLPSTARPLTTAAVMRLSRLDAVAQGELWDRGRSGGPGGAWAGAVATLAAGIAANQQASPEFVATVASHLWSGDAAARLESVPHAFAGSRDPGPVSARRRTLHDLFLARLRSESGDEAGTSSLEDLMAEHTGQG